MRLEAFKIINIGNLERKLKNFVSTEQLMEYCNNDKYSVLMSVHNMIELDELRASIDSMLQQTVKCDQFVLVEDGLLPEKLEAAIKCYETENPGLFTIVRLLENNGLGKALDIGLSYCNNELVARMDADDISLPERCEKLLALFRDNKKLSLAGTNINEFYDDPSVVVSSREVPSDYESICSIIRRRCPFNHPTVMFKKSQVLKAGGYGGKRYKQDLYLFTRMINRGCYALNINEPLLLFRADKDSYKRRSSWEYCKGTIDVKVENYKEGYCSFIDLAVVCIGQVFMHVSPMWLMKWVSDNFLRKKIQNNGH